MTHFLEKNLVINLDGSIKPSRYAEYLVRPCKWDYNKVLDYLTGKFKTKEPLELEGQVAMFNGNGHTYYSSNEKRFLTLEEWIVYLNLEKGIMLDFEETHISCYNQSKDYIIKTVDLHTGTTLYDSTETTIHMLKRQWTSLRPFHGLS